MSNEKKLSVENAQKERKKKQRNESEYPQITVNEGDVKVRMGKRVYLHSSMVFFISLSLSFCLSLFRTFTENIYLSSEYEQTFYLACLFYNLHNRYC